MLRRMGRLFCRDLRGGGMLDEWEWEGVDDLSRYVLSMEQIV